MERRRRCRVLSTIFNRETGIFSITLNALRGASRHVLTFTDINDLRVSTHNDGLANDAERMRGDPA